MSLVGVQASARNMAVFIDADNFNDAAALESALQSIRLKAERVLFRRAYGRPDSLKAIDSVLSRHAIRPVANFVLEKVTTDCSLVIDAVEAICTNDIQSVVICSGDTDFVPLALWLREKGCRVSCYSLSNKIFSNPERFFDEVVLLGRKQGGVTERTKQAPMQSVVSPVAPIMTKPVVAAVPSKAVVQKKKQAVIKADAKAATANHSVKGILNAVPELKLGKSMPLAQVAEKLRKERILSKNGSSPKLFLAYPAQFELTPKGKPVAVRYRG